MFPLHVYIFNQVNALADLYYLLCFLDVVLALYARNNALLTASSRDVFAPINNALHVGTYILLYIWFDPVHHESVTCAN